MIMRNALTITAALALAWSFAAAPAGADEHKSSAPEGYELVYEEDFEDKGSVDRWVFSDPGAWERGEEDGNHFLAHGGSDYSPPHRSPRNIGLVGDLKLRSFVLHADLEQTGKDYGHRDMCVFYNFVDPANYYYTHIATKEDPHAHNIMIVDDKPRVKISDTTTDGHDWGRDEWHHLKLVRDADSGRIEIYVNNMKKPIMTAKDKTHGWGHLGFGSFDDQGRVDNIKVYAPKAKKKKAGFFKSK